MLAALRTPRSTVSGRSRLLRGGPLHALAVLCGAALASLPAACRSASAFSTRLPAALPDLHAWERSSGHAEFDAPPATMDYELYVSPARPGVYSVTRYRVSRGTPGKAFLPGVEKLQWDRDGHDVRRYECLPRSGAGEAACAWHELAHGSAAYDAELPTLLAVYSLHANLLHRRGGGGSAP
jgi:hypothetical protein